MRLTTPIWRRGIVAAVDAAALISGAVTGVASAAPHRQSPTTCHPAGTATRARRTPRAR
jgi:hypothetical protein